LSRRAAAIETKSGERVAGAMASRADRAAKPAEVNGSLRRTDLGLPMQG